MGVPAHDDNDNKFADKFSIPVKQIFSEDGIRPTNSGEYSGLELIDARKRIEEKLKRL